MTRYYFSVFIFNMLFSVLFYIKMKHSGLSLRSFVLISGVSLLSGLIFPVATGFFNLYVALGINIIIVSLGAYFIAGQEGISDKEPKEQPFQVEAYLTQRYENDLGITDERSTDEEIIDEEPVVEEIAEEQPVDGEIIDEEPIVEKIAEEQPVDGETIDEEPVVEEIAEEQPVDGETIDEEPVVEEIAEEQSVDEEIIDEEPVVEEIAEEQSMNEENIDEEFIEDSDTEKIDEKIIEFLIEKEAEMELVAVAAEADHTSDESELRESYINQGFEAKFEGELEKAVQFFTAVLELSPPPDLELMLSLDLFSMFRELGHYDRAKDCLKKFADRDYAGLSASDAAEIKISLKHLEILSDLLIKANTPRLPYSRVPALIKLGAEEKLNSWKNEIF